MGKGRIKRFLQRLAIMLSVVLAVPQVPMVSNLGIGMVRAHADEKKDAWFNVYVNLDDIGENKITFIPGYAYGENPTGTIKYEYSTSPVVYTDETQSKVDHTGMTWTEITSDVSATASYTWTFPEGVLGNKVTFCATYSGDNTYKSDTCYREEDFRASVITNVTYVTKSTEGTEAGKYTFDLYLEEIRPTEKSPYYVMLTPYNKSGYDNTKPMDLVSDCFLRKKVV